MQAFFRVTPPSVHRMVVELETKGLIRRQPGQARSIELLVPPDTLPPLREPCTKRSKSLWGGTSPTSAVVDLDRRNRALASANIWTTVMQPCGLA